VATRTATPLVPHRVATTPARRAEEVSHCRRQRRLPRLLTSTSQLAPPRKVQTFGDHQVRREARPHLVAQVLRPLHRERWRKQRHQVPLLPLLPGPSSTHMARVAGQALDR
jgi:hypothetical protein